MRFPLILTAVALLAVWLPATRASKLHPNAGVAYGVIQSRLQMNATFSSSLAANEINSR
jgi:hypothetical protein